jgi:hypothetical protein
VQPPHNMPFSHAEGSSRDDMAHGVKQGLRDIDKIASRVSGKCVSSLEMRDNGRLAILFGDGSTLSVECRSLRISWRYRLQRFS